MDNDIALENTPGSPGDTELAAQESLNESPIVVHTILDMDLQLEIGKATHSKTIRFVALAFVLVIIIYNVINLLVMKDNVLLLAIISVGPGVLLFIFAFWIHAPFTMVRSIRLFKKHGRWPEYLISFSDHGFETHSTISGKTYEHCYSEISKIRETPSLILLICQATVVALAKDSFIKGTQTELDELIRCAGASRI